MLKNAIYNNQGQIIGVLSLNNPINEQTIPKHHYVTLVENDVSPLTHYIDLNDKTPKQLRSFNIEDKYTIKVNDQLILSVPDDTAVEIRDIRQTFPTYIVDDNSLELSFDTRGVYYVRLTSLGYVHHDFEVEVL